MCIRYVKSQKKTYYNNGEKVIYLFFVMKSEWELKKIFLLLLLSDLLPYLVFEKKKFRLEMFYFWFTNGTFIKFVINQ